jgi:hypothetical protein
MTEEEAKTKTCCKGSEMRIKFNGPCIASACMAWRWNEPWTSQTEEGHGGDLVIRLKRKPGEPKLGYCGLAGKDA